MRAPQLVYTATACAALRAAAVRRLRPTRRLINMRGLDAFAAAADASWTRALNADPESKQHVLPEGAAIVSIVASSSEAVEASATSSTTAISTTDNTRHP